MVVHLIGILTLGAWHSTNPRVGLKLAQCDLHIALRETNMGPYDVDFGLSLVLDDLVNFIELSYSVHHSANVVWICHFSSLDTALWAMASGLFDSVLE